MHKKSGDFLLSSHRRALHPFLRTNYLWSPCEALLIMKILSIETSCDETALSIVEASGGLEKPTFKVLSNLVLSQVKIHEKYGGVFPSLAKREHAKNLVPLLQKALEEAGLYSQTQQVQTIEKFETDLSHEPELSKSLAEFLGQTKRPDIDLIAVTYGPGLEPALWVGINAAKVLNEIWKIPVMPVNHMEGHICSVLFDPTPTTPSRSSTKSPVEFPALALLISGGHTELVLLSDWLSYKVVGQTRDDAVGEAYDKVARMLGLPYPGGPKVADFAVELRAAGRLSRFNFPRPMLKSPDLDFSFSGLKTSVLYALRKISLLSVEGKNVLIDLETKKEIALAFEDAIIETLVVKTKKAIEEFAPKTLIIAGGVIANKTIRDSFQKLTEQTEVKLLTPTHELSTDNALMIAIAAYIRKSKQPDKEYPVALIRAEGNVQLS